MGGGFSPHPSHADGRQEIIPRRRWPIVRPAACQCVSQQTELCSDLIGRLGAQQTLLNNRPPRRPPEGRPSPRRHKAALKLLSIRSEARA